MRNGISRRKSWGWTIACSCLSMWVATQSWGFEDSKVNPGLSGLLPTSAPVGLSEEDFATLSESIDSTWKKWTVETGDLVKKLYEGENSTVESQRDTLSKLKIKLTTLDRALSDSKYKSVHAHLARLKYALAPEVYISDAILNALTQDASAAQEKRLAPALAKVRQAANAVDKDLNEFKNGDVWREWTNLQVLKSAQVTTPNINADLAAVKTKFEKRETYEDETKSFINRESFLKLEDALGAALKASNEATTVNDAELRQAYATLLDLLNQYRTQPSVETEGKIRSQVNTIRTQSPDGGVSLSSALSRNYLNYNLRLTVAEGFLNRMLEGTRAERGFINECADGALIKGSQYTQVTTRVKLVPNTEAASFNINLNGVVRSNANGYTHQATVATVGYHTFSASRPVTFDGNTFRLGQSTVNAFANNQAVGVNTKFSWIPVLGGFADRVAFREADSRMPRANASTAQRIRQQVANQLQSQSSIQFANASKSIQANLYAPLRKYDLYPNEMRFSTTDKVLRLNARIMNENETAGSLALPVSRVPANGAVVQIHESLLTHSFDRLGLNGQTMTEDQVRDLLESRLSELTGRDIKFPAPPVSEEEDAEVRSNTLVFDQQDPVRFSIDNGTITLFIRAGLKRDNGEDIPTQIISVPFTPSIQGDKIVLTRGNVGVRPVERASNVAGQVARAQVMRQKIQSALPERSIDSTFDVRVDEKTVSLRASDILLEGGWLQFSLN